MSVAGVEIECESDQSTDYKIKRERGDHSRVTKIEKFQLFTTLKAIDGSDLARMSKILFLIQFCSIPCLDLVAPMSQPCPIKLFVAPRTHGQACPIHVCLTRTC